MAPTTKLWPINAHTLGKHLVLRGYLDAWLPIMGSRQEKIVFIDGFAGPGQYADGEDGSPIIAIPLRTTALSSAANQNER